MYVYIEWSHVRIFNIQGLYPFSELTVVSLHVATLTIKRELHGYEHLGSLYQEWNHGSPHQQFKESYISRISIYVATLTVKESIMGDSYIDGIAFEANW